jgi:uncharacterized protein (TIGR00369 family)
VTKYYKSRPFLEHLGIQITKAEDGIAEGWIELEEYHSWSPDNMVVHGGVTYALADTVGGAAVISATESVTPTIDMRIDYMNPATGKELHASAEVLRVGGSVSIVDITVTDGEDKGIAECRGVFKSGGADGGTPWTAERDGE